MAEAFVDTLRCGLTGQIMTDPVLVCTQFNPNLVCGISYERTALQRWLRAQDDHETKFLPNPALKGVIGWYQSAIGGAGPVMVE